MDGEEVVVGMEVEPKYLGNVLASFENGCQIDLRVKLAIEFLKSPYFAGAAVGLEEQDEEIARRDALHALDLASALIEEGQARGLVLPLPDHGELTSSLRKHIERGARAQVYQQVAGQRAAREESSPLHPAGASIHPIGGQP